jgi:hypothetical protein
MTKNKGEGKGRQIGFLRNKTLNTSLLKGALTKRRVKKGVIKKGVIKGKGNKRGVI